MRIVSLHGKNKQAKQIIKKHGERWEVLRAQPYVKFDANRGPWLLVQPLTEERSPATDMRSARQETASRWVHEHFDYEFKVSP